MSMNLYSRKLRIDIWANTPEEADRRIREIAEALINDTCDERVMMDVDCVDIVHPTHIERLAL